MKREVAACGVAVRESGADAAAVVLLAVVLFAAGVVAAGTALAIALP